MCMEFTSRDKYFMDLAKITSNRSKDPNTKVGACIVKNKRVVSLGYNGAPRRISDDLVPYSYRDKSLPRRENKYMYILHAEVSAILNSCGRMEDLEESSIYVTTFPCVECTKILIQCGISSIYYLNEYTDSDDAKYLCDLAGVSYFNMES